MPINTVTLATSVYDRRLKDFIQAAEEARLDVYVDFAGQGKRANPTIGWGFTLNRDAKGRLRNPYPQMQAILATHEFAVSLIGARARGWNSPPWT
jgi:hypothetical protein